MPKLIDQAIKAAINQDWELAIDLNQHILSQTPSDIPTLNRLAFAFSQQGDLDQAKTTYQKVLQLDPYNPIANKNAQKLSNTNINSVPKPQQVVITSFIEEPGKTKTIQLLKPADTSLLSLLNPGMILHLSPKKKRLIAETTDGKYVGCLPDDIGFRLIKLLTLGYKYQTIIKSVETKSICVFIKETSRGKLNPSIPSFVSNSSPNFSFIPSQVLEEEPIDITPTGEEDTQDI